jgi:hypothetical protein
VRTFRRWLARWGDVVGSMLVFCIGVGLFLSRGLVSFLGPFGAVLAVVSVVMAIKDARDRKRKEP